MSIRKHEFPILEFDTDECAVIQPGHECPGLRLPERAVFAFLSDEIDEYAKAHGAEVVGEFESATKMFPVYVLRHEGQEICLAQAPTGAAPAAQFLDWLIALGARKIISAGSCGALEDIPENAFLIPVRALRDEGTSYHYAPPSRFIETDPLARSTVKAALAARGLPWREVAVWTTDGFFRETAAKVAYRRAEGCVAVEMECAALAACAQFRGALWGELLFTADTLADAERYDPRGWGGDSFAAALQLCLDAVVALGCN